MLARSLEKFSESQAESALELVERIACIGSSPSEMQAELVNNARKILGSKTEPGGKWE